MPDVIATTASVSPPAVMEPAVKEMPMVEETPVVEEVTAVPPSPPLYVRHGIDCVHTPRGARCRSQRRCLGAGCGHCSHRDNGHRDDGDKDPSHCFLLSCSFRAHREAGCPDACRPTFSITP